MKNSRWPRYGWLLAAAVSLLVWFVVVLCCGVDIFLFSFWYEGMAFTFLATRASLAFLSDHSSKAMALAVATASCILAAMLVLGISLFIYGQRLMSV